MQLFIGISGLGDRFSYKSGTSTLVSRVIRETGAIGLRYHWNDNIKRIVDTINDYVQANGPDLQINFSGHSYGVPTMCKVAKRIKTVYRMFSLDGVWRPYNCIPSLRSLGGNGTIKVPSSVENLWVWYQTDGKIRGSKVAVGPKTTIHVYKELRASHMDMDMQQHDTILQELIR